MLEKIAAPAKEEKKEEAPKATRTRKRWGRFTYGLL